MFSSSQKLPSFSDKFFTIIAVGLPPLGCMLAIIFWWNDKVNALDLWLLAIFYLITGFGITVGYHRLFTHQSFKAKPWLKMFLAVAGSGALEGSVIDWCFKHKRHHQISDTQEDEHSPHHSGKGLWGIVKGLWHAQVGWIFQTRKPTWTEMEKGVPHLTKDRQLVIIDRLFPLWVIASISLPAIIGGVIEKSWGGAFRAFVWGSMVRVFLVHHTTWFINSLCHMFGTREFDTGDYSTNNWFCGIAGLGEGYHNNHHEFPYSAQHGLFKRQFDLSYFIIKVLEFLGLASKVLVPSNTEIQKHRLKSRATN